MEVQFHQNPTPSLSPSPHFNHLTSTASFPRFHIQGSSPIFQGFILTLAPHFNFQDVISVTIFKTWNQALRCKHHPIYVLYLLLPYPSHPFLSYLIMVCHNYHANQGRHFSQGSKMVVRNGEPLYADEGNGLLTFPSAEVCTRKIRGSCRHKFE